MLDERLTTDCCCRYFVIPQLPSSLQDAILEVWLQVRDPETHILTEVTASGVIPDAILEVWLQVGDPEIHVL